MAENVNFTKYMGFSGFWATVFVSFLSPALPYPQLADKDRGCDLTVHVSTWGTDELLQTVGLDDRG